MAEPIRVVAVEEPEAYSTFKLPEDSPTRRSSVASEMAATWRTSAAPSPARSNQ